MRWADVKLPLLTFFVGGFMMASAFLPSCVTTNEQAASTRWGDITQYGKARHPIVVAKFHADTRIVGTPLQKSVNDAVEDMDRMSCGLVKFSVEWDLDVASGLPRAMLHGDNVIMSMTAADALKEFGDKEGEKLLGYTRWGGSREIFLVAEKLEDPELAEWVAAHEMSHAIGMEHVQLGLMEETAPWFFNSKPQWERDDLREFCRNWDCQLDMFDGCRER